MKECCQDLSKRELRREADLVVSVCTTCGCRHFELNAEKGSLGLKGAKL
jgi:hypothetical protein